MAVATTDWRTFAWGSTTNGQLGVGAIENENVNVPSVVQQLSGREIRHIACGRNHTLFVLSDGTVYSCGSNDCGQLGRENQRSRPLLITLLETQTIQLASAGDQHSIAVTESGQVFAWGDNTHGQLGVGFTDETHILSPKLVKKIEKLHVLQVACGSYHTLALTDIGHIFAWGRNTNCQLGLGYFSQKEDTPHHIACLQGLVVKQITCGGDHSCALSVSGSLYCWGKNNFGQLGIGTTEDSKKPAACITLQNQEAQVVACGHDHTAVLTLDGGVFTFGSGMYGQLGHNCTNNEARPRKIFEMMGYNASQIACGRCHTLVYVPSSGVVYAFGLGANGQQGGGSYKNNQIPAQVKASLIPVHGRNNRDTSRVVHRLHAGGDQSFVTTSNPQSERLPVDYRLLDDKHSIPTWTTEKLNTLASYDNTTKVPDTVNRLINRLFSAPTCLNGSFLLDCDRHTNICSKHSGVDFDAAQTFFTSLGNLQNPAISKAIISLIDQHLLQSPGFGDQCKNAECLRGLLTLPLCHVFTSFEQHFLTICKCAERIVALDDEMGKILDSWWSHIPAEYFARLVSIFKGCVRHILFTQSLCPSTHQKNMKACLDVLKKLNVINNGKRQIVSYELFYIHKLHEVIKIPAVYQHWIECKVNNKRSPGLQFCDYPFIFDGSGKTLLLQADANFQMQVAVYHEVANNPFMLLNPQSKNVYLQLNVNRNDMINDTVLQLTSKNFQDYKKPLRVEFKGEEAMDAGGVKKEFFLLLLRDILDPVYGMFTYKEDSRLLWFNNQAFEGPDMYMLIGVLCGLAIYNSTIIAINFPLALYKKLLKRPITLDDIKELEPSVGRSFQSILDYEGDDFQEAFDITFEWGEHVFGSLVNKELIPGGKDIPVTQENKEQYVDAYIDYRFHKSVDNSFKPFFMGFHRVCGGDVLELFHPQELQALIVGNESYDWEMLEKNCEYKHGYAKTDRPIKYFWNVFHNLELEDKKKFLAFLTGSNRIPITGMKSLQMLIQPMAGADDSLPVAHTCFNLMDLPRYSTEQILQHKLLLAIQHCEGFGLV